MSLSSKPIRLVLPLLVVVLTIASVAAGAVVTMTLQAANTARASLTLRESAKSDVDRFAFLNERVKFLKLTMITYPDNVSAVKPRVEADVAEMAARLTHVLSLPLDGTEKQSVEAIKKANESYATMEAGMAGRTDVAKIVQDYETALANIAAATTASQSVLQVSVDRQGKVVQDATGRTGALAGSLAACLAALSIFLFLFSRQLVRRLTVLTGAIDQVATGDLTVTTTDSGKDEVAHIGAALNTMTTNLRAVVSSVSDTSSRLDASARELESVAVRVGSTVDEAASQADLAARSAGEVSMNVQSVSSGSREMGQSIADIGRNAQEAVAVATGAVRAVEETTDKMSKLGDSSREIGDVVRLITSIAEQTNLLALNATIEAARAGDAGKGFAVVADEVKQLAQETARATEDISRRVETIQADAGEAAQSISQIAGVIGRINEFQTTIASAVEEQTAATETINQSVSEAAAGSARIAQNISGVAGATSETAATALGARESAQQLLGMSQELRRLVDTFRH